MNPTPHLSKTEWCKLDDLIKMWILDPYVILLSRAVVVTTPDARAINLDNEVRSIKIGKMTVNEYCTKIRSMSDRLINLGCVVSDKNLVIYTINGLDSRFATLVEIIRNRETFPSFENVRTMLLLKESSFNNDSGSSTDFSSSSSSPTVLLASNQSNNKGNLNKPSNLPQLCNHFNKGTCKFGDRCKYIHDHRNRSGLNNKSSRNFGDRATVYSSQLNRNMHWASQPPSGYHSTRHGPILLARAYLTGPNNLVTPFSYGVVQQPAQPAFFLPLNSQGILGAAPALHPSQATSLPSAFSTMTLHDPTWNMDTGATSHLNSNAHNLSTLFNSRLYPSIHVGDGNSIPVTNTGHSIIPSLHRPLHLHNVLVTPNIIKNLIFVRQFTRDNNCTIKFDAFGFCVKDFLTRHILLRCDSSGDLYPVTKPSTVPTAFVSTSSSTWHQRLGHPGDDVLRSLSSRHLISCNKERSPHVCHACQLDSTNCSSIVNRSIWLFKHKFHADCTLSRYKARLVANGSSQQLGVDFDETFSPVVKQATIRMVLSLAVSRRWPIHQLDVKNAFVNGDLSETALPLGLDFLYFLLSSTSAIIDSLHKEKYALQFFERAHWLIVYPSGHPVDTDSKLGPDGVPVQDPTLYRSLAGGLQYLTFTRPDLSYAVQQICLYMHDPREPHFSALKPIMRYVQGTMDLGLYLYAFATTSLVGYTDADWVGCPSTRRSTFGYCVFLGDNLLSWSAKRQHTISRSSAEAEYRGVANVVAETAWIRNLLRELHSPLLTATLIVYCDSCAAGHVRILHVPSRFQYADIFTKGLPSFI
ncbi:ribonuclease H-like domain-containing protein [Tanacetum coccineum]